MSTFRISSINSMIVCLVVLPFGCDSMDPLTFESTSAYAERGSFGVGTLELVIGDAERPLDVTVWYPAEGPTDESEVKYYTSSPADVSGDLPVSGVALADAKPAGGAPFPLVVFSHGNESYRQYAAYLTEHLASHGFVVMAANHFGDDLADTRAGQAINEGDEPDYFVYRPRDITRLIDLAQEQTDGSDTLAGIIDLDRVAVMGHSFGGFTALAAGGARLNLDEYDELFCQNPSFQEVDFVTCDEFAPQSVADRVAEVANLEAVPGGTWPSFADPRVDAIVALAPGFTPMFGRTGLQFVTLPLLGMIGTVDPFAGDFGALFWFENIRSETRVGVALDNAGHNIFSNTCDRVPWEDPEICGTDDWDDSVHEVIEHFVTAFLLAELQGDADGRAALGLTAPGITTY